MASISWTNHIHTLNLLYRRNHPIANHSVNQTKPHYEFLLPPKEGEGQDEGALVLRDSKADYLPRFLHSTLNLHPQSNRDRVAENYTNLNPAVSI